ncbi:MAG: Uma2 family endonuclease [bacterium]|nr:Uma2 family endonuclease [bacterium]
MAAGQVHGKTVANVVIELGRFVRPRGLGTLVASDSGVLLERDPDTVREPDVAFTSAERLPPGSEVEGYAEVIPDLVAEVASRGDSRYEVYDKARMLLGHGVRLVRVVNPRTRTVRVHHPDLRL